VQKALNKSSTKKLSLDSSTSGSSSSLAATAEGGKGSLGSKGKRLVLHTVEQPDGGVIGYCTEEPAEHLAEEKR